MNTGDIIKAGITLARIVYGRDSGEGVCVLTASEPRGYLLPVLLRKVGARALLHRASS